MKGRAWKGHDKDRQGRTGEARYTNTRNEWKGINLKGNEDREGE